MGLVEEGWGSGGRDVRCLVRTRGEVVAWERTGKGKKAIEFEEEKWGNVTGVLSREWVRYTGDLAGKEKTGGHLNLRKIVPGVDRAFWDPED